MAATPPKPVVWVGSSLKTLKTFPEAIEKEIGDALQEAQFGLKSLSTKPLIGFILSLMFTVIIHRRNASNPPA